MNINAAIIDQRIHAINDEIRDRARNELRISQEEKLKSLAFVYLSIRTILDFLSNDEIFECLVEGGQDSGIDAIHISEENDLEFTVSLFQGKYKQNLEGSSNFPENGIIKLISAIKCLFDPSSSIGNVNDRLKTKIEEVRSLIRDGYIPQIRVLLCNNGLKWNESADETIRNAGLGSQVSWEHVNHDRIVTIIQAPKQVDDSLQFTGKAMQEDFNYSRALLGRVAVTEIATLIERHGERLLERNIRRYLGLQGNRVNEAIRGTLMGQEPHNFYFYHNGITLTCDKFSYNALQGSDYKVRVENLQIINGGQTCMTIYKTLADAGGVGSFKDAYVLVRLYELPKDNEGFVSRITFATNSQNPVDLRDLRANDDIQRRLETDMIQLGYSYRRKRTDSTIKSTDITSGVAAEAILSVWRKKPHQAKFFSREHFGKLYNEIFTHDLNGAQTIASTLLYRIPESRRRRLTENDPPFIRYASCFLAMRMGRYLLADLGCEVSGLTHLNFKQALDLIEEKGDQYFERAVLDVDSALKKLYKDPPSLQQLSATFRRGDLVTYLN